MPSLSLAVLAYCPDCLPCRSRCFYRATIGALAVQQQRRPMGHWWQAASGRWRAEDASLAGSQIRPRMANSSYQTEAPTRVTSAVSLPGVQGWNSLLSLESWGEPPSGGCGEQSPDQLQGCWRRVPSSLQVSQCL